MSSNNFVNNFDLIRLVAATQVVVYHSIKHFDIIIPYGWNTLYEIGKLFPGVPIFFTLSGFLIYWSLSRNSNMKKYAINRSLRIFPALWFCFFITLLELIFFDVINLEDVFTLDFWYWTFAQLTIFQFWIPDLLRDFGVGHPNGSLWTIPVELQFYAVLPMLFFISKRKKNAQSKSLFYGVVLVVFFLIGLYIQTFPKEQTLTKLLRVSILPYLYNFLIGVLLFVNFDRLKKYIEGTFFLWILAYIAFSYWNTYWLDTSDELWKSGLFQLSNDLLLGLTILSAAYSYKTLSNSLLHGYDISYGVYIYHMLVVNALLSLGGFGSYYSLVLTIVITYSLATFSWVFIEKRSLQLKSKFK